MKFDLWTFAFQIVNFTVLLFILRRLLYKPVREIMEKRRAMAAQTMAEAEAARQEAQALKERHRAELDGLRGERVRLVEEMKGEVGEERRRLLEEAGREAQRLIDRERALFDTEKKRHEAAVREMAIDAAGLFAVNICRDLADEGFHGALYRRLLEETGRFAAQLRTVAPREEALAVEVVSAYPLTGEEECSLRDALAAGTDREVILATSVDRELMAGMKLRTCDLVCDASLSGQVAGFAARLREGV